MHIRLGIAVVSTAVPRVPHGATFGGTPKGATEDGRAPQSNDSGTVFLCIFKLAAEAGCAQDG
jgi:hypothetical protein